MSIWDSISNVFSSSSDPNQGSGTISFPKTNMPDQIDRGKNVFTYFHNEAINFPSNYSLSFNGVVQLIGQKSPNFFQLFGKAVQNSLLDETTLRNRMIALADTNGGLLPTELSLFLKAVDPVNIEAGSMTWGTTFKAVAAGVYEGSAQIGETVSNIGTAGITGITGTFKYLPLILGAGIAVYAFTKAKLV